MAFWGVEVRPGKPFAQNFDQSRGRLRITQATLGDGKSTGKSTMQCNVGNKSPVLLCSLVPNVSETCHLELEFEEDEEVTFSVLGQRSIHLAGYFLSHGRNLGGGDSDSYGEDIAESDTSGSYNHGSEDEYESDFIDDGDIEIYSDSLVHKSSVVIEEIEDEDKHFSANRKLLRLRKKYEHSDPEVTETGTKQLIVRNNELSKVVSEDEDGFPILCSMGGENSKNKKKNREKKRKIDGVIHDNVLLSAEGTGNHGLSVPSEAAIDVNKKSKKKKKEKGGKHNIVSEIDEKQKDQNDSTDMGNKSEIDAKFSTENNEEKTLKTPNGAIDTDNEPSLKKSKKKQRKDIAKEGTLNEKDSSKRLNMAEVLKEDGMPFDSSNADASPATIDGNTARKKKKKNKKNKCDSDIKQVVSAEGKADLQDGFDDSKHEPKASKTRTFPNGLIVEEVSMGKPDGKRASPGKKVSVHYIGKLKSGSIFDSNIGQKPFKFRLGIGEVIKGWDTGVNGMRIGDKRRLTIPPSFGYGAKGVGKIPPNSWVIFDVELVDVQ